MGYTTMKCTKCGKTFFGNSSGHSCPYCGTWNTSLGSSIKTVGDFIIKLFGK
ncbi:MAG: hypothetical protein IJP79_08470 [Paludibacteraceae bacterium]|nr:hypothetical protein [Paludibacteraceae bacterium]MBQ6963722.1 hypothetical protein [Paludibacteraceae bacterium]